MTARPLEPIPPRPSSPVKSRQKSEPGPPDVDMFDWSGKRDMKALCFVCDRNLFDEEEPDMTPDIEKVKNIFGYSCGPNENPFAKKPEIFFPTVMKQDPIQKQPFLLRCGHVYHKGCIKQILSRPCGSYSTAGKCPICNKVFCLSKSIVLKLQCRPVKASPEEKDEINVVKQRMEDMKEEEGNLTLKMETYSKMINEAQRDIVNEGVNILKNIRKIRHIRREFDEFKRTELDPYETLHSNIENDSKMWKILVGDDFSLEENIVTTDLEQIKDQIPIPEPQIPTKNGNGTNETSNKKVEDTNEEKVDKMNDKNDKGPPPLIDPKDQPKGDDVDVDYTEFWENIKVKLDEYSKDDLTQEDPDLLPNGLYNEIPNRDSDDEYDFAKMVEKLRVKVKEDMGVVENITTTVEKNTPVSTPPNQEIGEKKKGVMKKSGGGKTLKKKVVSFQDLKKKATAEVTKKISGGVAEIKKLEITKSKIIKNAVSKDKIMKGNIMKKGSNSKTEVEKDVKEEKKKDVKEDKEKDDNEDKGKDSKEEKEKDVKEEKEKDAKKEKEMDAKEEKDAKKVKENDVKEEKEKDSKEEMDAKEEKEKDAKEEKDVKEKDKEEKENDSSKEEKEKDATATIVQVPLKYGNSPEKVKVTKDGESSYSLLKLKQKDKENEDLDEFGDKIPSDYELEELSKIAEGEPADGEPFDEMAMRKFKDMLAITLKFEYKVENNLFEFEKELDSCGGGGSDDILFSDSSK